MTRYLRAANVKDGAIVLDDVKEMNFTPREREVFSLRPGDVLVTEGAGSLAAVGAATVWNGELPEPICFQNTLLRLRPRRNVDARFLAWWSKHAYSSGLFASVASGANIFHLSAERVRALAAWLPEPSEQVRIADFLDAETARIDRLIEKKRRMMERIDERLDSGIYFAVTRGLRADVDFTPVRVSWIGELPRHWGMPALGANYHVQLGKMLNPAAADGPTPFPYLRNTNVQWDRLDLRDLKEMHFDDDEQRRLKLAPGDLLVCEGGEVGRAAIWQGELERCFFQKAIHRVRPLRSGNTRFLMYCLRAAARRNVFKIEGNQSTIVHLTAEQLRVHRFPWPPPAEQDAIVRYLDTHAKERHAFGERLERQIALLNEHRQALVTAAVTGQLDVASLSR